MYIDTHMYMRIQMHVCTQTHIHPYTPHTYIHTHIHIHTYINIHTYTYRIGQKFGGRKVWRIWQILPNRQTLFTKHITIQLLLSVL